MKRAKIALACNWGQTPSQLFNQYKKQTPNNSGIWEGIEGIPTLKGADYLIILGSTTKDFGFNRDRILQFRREPNKIEKWKPLSNIKHNFDYMDGGYHISSWQFTSPLINFDFLSQNNFLDKNKKISTISSSKWGHRNNFLVKVSNKNKGKIDMYGPPDTQRIFGKKNYRPLHPQYKDNALINYSYSIAIENSQQDNYFTEKINDCYLTNTFPLYWGCPNIEEYFPQYSYKKISLDNPNEIEEIIKDPLTQKNQKALKEAKHLVMYKYNFWPTLYNLIK